MFSACTSSEMDNQPAEKWTSPQRLPMQKRGFTLLELLLTLALLIIIFALAWPALVKPMANQRLRKAADRVRTDWARARVEAMSSGQTYIFRYMPESNRYWIECRAGADFAPEAEADEFAFGREEHGEADGLPTGGQTERLLPEDISFAAGQTRVDSRAAAFQSDSPAIGAEPLEAGRSKPILFYPDGTTSSARLMLKNKQNRRIELALRGLTGVVTVGQLRSTEERLP